MENSIISSRGVRVYILDPRTRYLFLKQQRKGGVGISSETIFPTSPPSLLEKTLAENQRLVTKD